MYTGVHFPGSSPQPALPWLVTTSERPGSTSRGGRRERSPSTSRPERRTTNTDGTRYELRLYVSPSSLNCVRARLALERVLQRFDPRLLALTVIDVRQDVDAAQREQILYTPTLILRDGAAPPTRVLGDLSSEGVLFDLFRLAGIEPL
jgi:hypothetical protein